MTTGGKLVSTWTLQTQGRNYYKAPVCEEISLDYVVFNREERVDFLKQTFLIA